MIKTAPREHPDCIEKGLLIPARVSTFIQVFSVQCSFEPESSGVAEKFEQMLARRDTMYAGRQCDRDTVSETREREEAARSWTFSARSAFVGLQRASVCPPKHALLAGWDFVPMRQSK